MSDHIYFRNRRQYQLDKLWEQVAKHPPTVQYHDNAKYIDCSLQGRDYCKACGWTDATHNK